jgi:hypothetical protein
MYEHVMGAQGMGTQQVTQLSIPPQILVMARAFKQGMQQAAPPPDPTLRSEPGGDADPNCAGCASNSDDVDPTPPQEPFSLEPGDTGTPWWVWGGLAVLALGAAGGAGYWFWWRPRQAAEAALVAEEV